MIKHDVEQGSAEWFTLRVGLPTASQFHRIITPARGELSAQARKYAYFLVAETLLNISLEPTMTQEWIERGKELEPEAAKFYLMKNPCEIERVGFVTTDDGRIGASPDRLIVGGKGALEIKCPAPHTHIGYFIDGPGGFVSEDGKGGASQYKPQVQGELYVAELEYADFLSYHPDLPPVLVRTERDEPYIAKLERALAQFCEIRDEMLTRLLDTGFFAERRSNVLTPVDVSAEQWASELRNMGIDDGI